MLSRPCYTPPVATAGESRFHSSLPGYWHLQMEHARTLNHPMSPGRGTAPWLPSPPHPGTGIMSLPSQHSRPGKHNPSTRAQLPHCTLSMAALPLSTVPTAFPQLPIKPSSLTSPGALPLLLTPPTLPACVTIPAPCSVPRTTQTNPAKLTPLPAQHIPSQPAAAGKESAASPPLPQHPSGPLGSNIFGNITLELGGGRAGGQLPAPARGRVPAHGTPLLLHFSFAQASPGWRRGRESRAGGGSGAPPKGMYMGRGWRTFQLP